MQILIFSTLIIYGMSVLYNLIMWWGQGGAGIGGCNRGVHELGSLGSKKLNKARMSTCNTSAFLSRHIAPQILFVIGRTKTLWPVTNAKTIATTAGSYGS